MRRSEKQPPKQGGYRLHRQREGTRITYWPDPRGPGHGEMYWGTVLDHMGDTVTISWDGDEEHYEVWDGRECRYRVDRGQMRFIPPPKERRIRLPDDQIFCKICGKPRQLKCGCPRPGALKPEEWGRPRSVPALLTPVDPHDMMVISNEGNALIEPKGAMMARKQAAAVVEDDEAIEEVAEATGSDTPADDMLTAKAAASKLGTDGRTLRKFLRKKHGTVGQGQRWAIAADDIDALKIEFEAWAKGGQSRGDADKPAKSKGKATPAAVPDEDADEIHGFEEVPDAEFDEIEDLDFGDDDD